MNKYLLGLTLVAATAAVVTCYPGFVGDAGVAMAMNTAPPSAPAETPSVTASRPNAARPRIEVVFALDTTGSMDGLISAAKEKIWSIASTMAQGQPAPEIRMGLVAYRDRGDDYVTQVIDLSDDLDSMYSRLMDFKAGGGGDGPESVNQALSDAVQKMSWSSDGKAYKVVFLVGDAPPHMDYQGEVQYPEIVKQARARGIVVNTIQCGTEADTAATWQRIASLSQGDFFNVAQNGNAVAVATPFDEKIATLSAAMDDTRLFYGDKDQQARAERKQDAAAKMHAEASNATRARRAAFNASVSGARNFLGDNELVDAVSSGRVDLLKIAPATLPAPLQAMAPAERDAVIKEKAEQRKKLQTQIADLAGQRDGYIEKQVAAQGGAKDSLDQKLHDVVSRQAAEVGLSYGAKPKY